MNFTIESGVPTAKYAKRKLGKILNYPIGEMQIGDSFVAEEPYSKETANRLRARINLLKTRENKRSRIFSVNKDPHSENARVWRVN